MMYIFWIPKGINIINDGYFLIKTIFQVILGVGIFGFLQKLELYTDIYSYEIKSTIRELLEINQVQELRYKKIKVIWYEFPQLFLIK